MFHIGELAINATIFWSWVVMIGLVIVSWLITRSMTSELEISPAQNLLEVIVKSIRDQIKEIGGDPPELYMPFVGTIFIYVITCNILDIVPGFVAPTGSISTTAALALCVFIAVPYYGISQRGLIGYMRRYVEPTPVLLPFNIVGDLSRSLAHAVRLFGNVMSGTMIGALLIMLVPFFFPVVMRLLTLLTGVIHAYIFAVLAMVFIASGTEVQRGAPEKEEGDADDDLVDDAI